VGLQPFPKLAPGAAQQDADVIHCYPKLLGDLRVANLFQASQAKDLRLPRLQLGERLPQVLRQFARRGRLTRLRRFVWNQRLVKAGAHPIRFTPPLPQLIERPRRSQPA